MSKGMNFLTSLLLFAAGVAIFIFLPVFQLDLGSQALKSETLLEYYENLIKDIQNVIEWHLNFHYSAPFGVNDPR